jgi:hypothetical protein
MRGPGPDDICALCDEYSVRQAAPEQAARGMGRCLVRDESGPLHLHVEWNGRTCVSFRLDRPNLATRRQYVALQRRAAATNESTEQ